MRSPLPFALLFSIGLLASWFSPVSGAEGDTLSILTYNIYYGGQDHDPVFGREEEWLDVIRSRDPDLVLIQEANGWLPSEQNYIGVYVESLNASSPGEPPYSGFVGEAPAFHVALLSRLPVLEFEAFGEVALDTEVVDIHHVFVHAVLDLGGDTAHAVGVHFKPGTARADREREGRALLEILDGLPPDETVWIGGDFNGYSPEDLEPGSPVEPDYEGGALPADVKGWEPMAYLLWRGYKDSFRILHPDTPGYTQATRSFLPEGMGPVQRVDFLLRSPGSTWELVLAEVLDGTLGDVASDHYAVFATYVDRALIGVGERDARRSSAGLRVWPHPVAGSARIVYALPRSGPVRVRVFSPAGRLVRTIGDTGASAGMHELVWDGTDDAGRALAPGFYFVRLENGPSIETARLLWLGGSK
ncbi:MAG: FlgD immunoglobulin-like domain containing protein [Candidatus Eisenbacteria bacterium]